MKARLAVYGLAALVGALAVLVVLAPAHWAAGLIERASQGHVRLADPQGTLWSGSGVVLLAAGRDSDAPATSLPERLGWQVKPTGLLTGTLDLVLTHPSALNQPLSVRAPLTGGPVRLGAATVRLPASLLVGLGAPFNTVRPGGQLQLTWDGLSIAPGRVEGRLDAEWRDASSSLAPVRPLGHYRLQFEGLAPGARVQLRTLTGPLELVADGTIEASGRLRMTGRARAMPGTDAIVRSQLSTLISLLGRPDGDGAQLSFGT